MCGRAALAVCVLRDLDLRAEAVTTVATLAAARGWGACAVGTSPLPGPSGNVEFFLWLRRGEATVGEAEILAEARRTAELGVPGEQRRRQPRRQCGWQL